MSLLFTERDRAVEVLAVLVLICVLGLVLPAASQQLPGTSEPIFATGLLDEDETAYRNFSKTPRYRAFLPVMKDLSYRFPKPGYQGRQGSCVGWAVGYAARSYYGPDGRLGGQLHSPVSASFIYNHIKDQRKDCMVGSQISDALNLLRGWGALTLAEFPYSERTCEERIFLRQHRERLARFRIRSWRRVDMRQLDNVKGQIAKGDPVIIGMSISRGFDALRGDTVYHFQDGDKYYSSHAVTVVGYSDRRHAFKIINSWSQNWGNEGFGWVDYDTFRKSVKYAYVMEVQKPKPPIVKVTLPKPKPQPVKITPPRPPSPPKGVDLPTFLQKLGSLQCSRLEPRHGPEGLELAGFVSTAEDLRKVQKLVAVYSMAIRLAIEVRPWPQCEALLTLKEPLKDSRGLTLEIASAKREPTLAEGENLVLTVTTPDFPAYLYMTYLQASGDAVHLIQPRSVVSRQNKPKSVITLGDGGGGGPRFVIGPPYGDEMVLAIASPAPLFDQLRKQTETEREYLTAIRTALLQKAPGTTLVRTVAAAAVTLKTRER